MEEIYCLWINILWNCSLEHLTTNSVFNIWIYLWSVAILFAWLSIINEKHKFRIRFYTNTNYLTILFLSWLFFSFIWYILPNVWWNPIIIVGYPIFWEFVSLIIYITFLWILWFSANKKITITKSNISKLTDFIIIEIAKWEQWIKVIWDELGYFFNDLLEKCITNEEQEYKTLFAILLDNNLCKYIWRISIRTFIVINNSYLKLYNDKKFNELNNYEKNQYFLFYRSVFNYSLSHENSIIYREMNWISFDKVNKWGWIFSLWIIENFGFVKELDLLSRDYWFELDNIEEFNYNKTFIEFFNKTLESFFNNLDKNIQYSTYLYQWYSWLSNILSQIKFKDLFINIQFLPRFLEIDSDYIKEYYNKRYWKESKEFIFNENHSFYIESLVIENSDLINVLSLSLFKLLTSCADLYNKTDEWYIRHIVLYMHRSYDINKYPYNKIDEKLKELFINWIKENLNLDFSILTLPILIDLYWYELFNWKYNKDWFYLEVLKLLGEGLPKIVDWSIYKINEASESEKLYLMGECNRFLRLLFINKESIIYNKENNKLIYYFWNKSSASEIDLNEVLRTWEINIRKL